MVTTTNARSWTTRRVLTAAGLGGVLAAGGVAAVLVGPAGQAAAAPGSSAQGVRVSGTGVDARAADSGSISGSGSGTSWSASGISTETRAGHARAAVGSITVGGQSIGSVTATCDQGVTTVQHSGNAQDTSYFHVSFGRSGGPSATGATITITDRHGRASFTLIASTVSCSETTGPPGSQPPTGKPTPPTGHPAPQPTHRPGHTTPSKPGRTAPKHVPDHEATPAPLQHGHAPVTG